MEDQNPNPQPSGDNNPPATPPAGDGQNPPAATQEQTIPYSRFKAVNDQVKALNAQIEELAKHKGDADSLKAELSTVRLGMLRRDVAASVGLPADLADRLRGDDEAALKADAEALLKMLPKPSAPRLDGNTPSGEAPVFTLAQINDPAFYDKNREAIMKAMAEGRIRG